MGMLQIVDNRKPEQQKRLDTIVYGSMFEYNDDIYMLSTNESEINNHLSVFSFKEGKLITLSRTTLVTPAKASLVWEPE